MLPVIPIISLAILTQPTDHSFCQRCLLIPLTWQSPCAFPLVLACELYLLSLLNATQLFQSFNVFSPSD